MKKKTIAIIFTLLIIIIAFVGIYSFLNNIKLKTEEQIVDIFNSNKEQFYNSTEVLSKYKNFHWSLRKIKDESNLYTVDYWKSETLNGEIVLTIRDKDYFEEIYSMKSSLESKECIQNILKKHKFKSIGTRIWDDCIYFIKQSTIGLDSGIVYCPTTEIPEEPYITKLTKIEDGWFYYEAK